MGSLWTEPIWLFVSKFWAHGRFVENLVFPAKDFHLLGAGPNQTVIDGNPTGSCLQFTQPVSNAMVVEGFSLTNGLGTSTNGPSPLPGGLEVAFGHPYGETRVENCVFEGNRGSGGGISLPVLLAPSGGYTEVSSIIEDPNNVATFVAPNFIDPLNNDYQLMIFPPCPLLPFIPDLFTLTNNFGPSCAQVIGSTPTPWTSILFPPIGFPITLTFQGIIEESPGVYVPTNGVIYRAE